MRLIKNWKQMYKSAAVILPAVVLAILTIISAMIDSEIVPSTWLPFIVLASGFVGRIVRQNNLGDRR